MRKLGTLNASSYPSDPELKTAFSSVWNWPEEGNHKNVWPDNVFPNNETIKTEMRNGVHAFFPASRHEDPTWLNPNSLNIGMDASANRRFNDRLDKPIRWVETCAEDNISWVLDAFLDSLIEPNLLHRVHTVEGRRIISGKDSESEAENIRNRTLLSQTRQNVEKMLKAILQDITAKLILNFRNIGQSRISIKVDNGQFIPTLQSLSADQNLNFFTYSPQLLDMAKVRILTIA